MSDRLFAFVIGRIPLIAVLLALAPSAGAGTLYVATNGVDGGGCGLKATPCRSISQAITNASLGDKIIVGPGRYRAIDGETPAPGCGCMLALNKAVSLESSHGAAETVIDGRASPAAKTVLIITDGGAFGKPRKGFSVTQTSSSGSGAMVIDANNVSIRGNQIISLLPISEGAGIEMVDSAGSVLLEGNQVVGWVTGIIMRGANKMVRKNVVAGNSTGISTSGGSSVQGNVVFNNSRGIFLEAGATTVMGNAVIANSSDGITNDPLGPSTPGTAFTGTVEKNNIFGNGGCGLVNSGVLGLVASNNYWGATTGPGADPADDLCNSSGGTSTVAPFATGPFKVKPAIKP